MMAIAQKCSLNLTHLPGTEEVTFYIYHLRNTPVSVQVKLNQRHLWRNVDNHKISTSPSSLI